MTTAHGEPVAYPFNEDAGLEISEAYSAARETAGMVRIQMPYGEPAWLATRYADARLVLRDQRFSRAMAYERDSPRLIEHISPGDILSMDPPDHTRLRTLVAKAFTMRRVELLRPRVARLADELIDGLRQHGQPADLVDLYALPIPVAVICELLGVPVADRPQFRKWSDVALSTSKMTVEEAEGNIGELREYFAGLIAERRAEPQDDLITALIEARDVQDRLTEREMLDLCMILLVGGHETTASQIPNFVYTLLGQREQWDRLCADPSLIPAAVEELLRFVPLGFGALFPRYAVADVEVGDVVVRKGEAVVVAPAAANRDALEFSAPDDLRFDREDDHHLAFGHGVHHCIGAPLARLELQEALRALTREMPGLHVAGDIGWKTETLVRGPYVMPVGW
ncbi:cytochrome P450 [Amycolatopsis jejuensis]|uniref:cytochrome P450 n=1 Tax=Amycolatopsis jejuensis TaxID=330084 RepID=UPI00052526B5|nr:cytochrome P450 [Amycolatopsis jejuensis]